MASAFSLFYYIISIVKNVHTTFCVVILEAKECKGIALGLLR